MPYCSFFHLLPPRHRSLRPSQLSYRCDTISPPVLDNDAIRPKFLIIEPYGKWKKTPYYNEEVKITEVPYYKTVREVVKNLAGPYGSEEAFSSLSKGLLTRANKAQ